MRSQYDGVVSNRGLVETELVREKVYRQLFNNFKNWLFKHKVSLKWTEVQIFHLLLRYIFNKKATVSNPISDPVFVIGLSLLARKQLEKDLAYEGVSDAEDLANFIDRQLQLAAIYVSSAQIDLDEPVQLLTSEGEKLKYKGRTQEDFAQLAKRYGPDYYNTAYALGLRYSYLRLAGHGFARVYKDATHLRPDSPLVCECFASAFNHYFDRYYSAFPDLEMPFGSSGCFFKLRWEEEPSGITYFMCPPFDDTLMQMCADGVLHILDTQLVKDATFMISIPGSWTDFNALEKLKKSPWVIKTTDYRKGDLPFLDYMSKSKAVIVFPTDICVLILSNRDKSCMDCPR